MLIVNYGGGVNSTAMLIGMHQRGIKPDLIMFADTGGEKPETYEYVGKFDRWLAAHDMPGITVAKAAGKHKTLEQKCLTNRTLPSLAFGWRKCSSEFKHEPMDRYLNGVGQVRDVRAAGRKPTKALGIDFGEIHRAKIFEDDKYVYEYPLVEWQWNRRHCTAAIDEAGLCIPPKSSCFFCPASKKREVIRLAVKHPGLFARAVALEHNAENLRQVKGLGRHWSWETLVELDAAQLRLLPDPPQISCTCRDGWEDDDDE